MFIVVTWIVIFSEWDFIARGCSNEWSVLFQSLFALYFIQSDSIRATLCLGDLKLAQKIFHVKQFENI